MYCPSRLSSARLGRTRVAIYAPLGGSQGSPQYTSLLEGRVQGKKREEKGRKQRGASGEGSLGCLERTAVLKRVNAKPASPVLRSIDTFCARRVGGEASIEKPRKESSMLRIYPIILDILHRLHPVFVQ